MFLEYASRKISESKFLGFETFEFGHEEAIKQCEDSKLGLGIDPKMATENKLF